VAHQLGIVLAVDEREFPIKEGAVNPAQQPYPYLAHWHWDFRPALRGVAKVDLIDHFCAHFLLSIEDGDHNVPEHLALFVHTLCRKVCKWSEFAVELNDIGFTIEDSYVCGYIRFRTGWLRSALEWSRSVSDLWLTDLYGPVYYETNALIVSGDMLRAWHRLVTAAVS
jgi:hypothetical protein